MKDRNQKLIELAGKFGISASHALTCAQTYTGDVAQLNETQMNRMCGVKSAFAMTM